MYQVIVNYDQKRERSYYHDYLTAVDAVGNFTCAVLPPYQDKNKARACYYDTQRKTWRYDRDKYVEILLEIERIREEEEQKRKEEEAILSNKELSDALVEIAQNQDNIEGNVAAQEENQLTIEEATMEIAELVESHEEAIMELAECQSISDGILSELYELYISFEERISALEATENELSEQEAREDQEVQEE